MLVCSAGSFLIIHAFKIVPAAKMSSRDYFYGIIPLGVIMAFNVVLGNVSLRYIPVSFMQTIKSLGPFWTVVVQYLFYRVVYIEKGVYLSIIPIVVGVMLATFSEANFVLVGFLSALTSSLIGAINNSVSGKLLSHKLDPINLIYNIAPWSFLVLAPIACYVELQSIENAKEIFLIPGLPWVLIPNALLALILNFSTFLFINTTSPLTYTVVGNCKVVITIILSVLIFGNKVSFTSGVGCFITLVGAMYYQRCKFSEQKKQKKLHSTHEHDLEADINQRR